MACLEGGLTAAQASLCTHAICNSTGLQICPSSTKNNAQLSRWCPNSATPAPARSRCHWLVSPTLPPKPCAQRRLSTCRIPHLASLSLLFSFLFFLSVTILHHPSVLSCGAQVLALSTQPIRPAATASTQIASRTTLSARLGGVAQTDQTACTSSEVSSPPRARQPSSFYLYR